MEDSSETKKTENERSGGVIPIVDSHCHIFGQTLYEGGDAMDLLKGLSPVLHHNMEYDVNNARKALSGVPEENKNDNGSYSKAIVPLHMDMGYTPLDPGVFKILNIGYRSQYNSSEDEQIALSDTVRT